MKVIYDFNDIKIFEPDIYPDDRGWFMPSFIETDWGLPPFVQDNHSRSQADVVRGLHFQWDPPMGKLMRVTRGAAFLVAVDIRKTSRFRGHAFGWHFTEYNRYQMWAPAGFARGFFSLMDDTEVQYKCTAPYNAKGEGSVLWNDPEIGLRWPQPLGKLIISEKDRNAQSLAEWWAKPESDLL